MSLKLIGGKYKNHTIKTPLGMLTKPTMSLMRKSVFDIIQDQIEEANFLDVFACSGAMGIEALSRGASFSTFIDNDRKAIKCIEENLKTLHLEKYGKAICGDAITILEKLNLAKKLFTIIYVDPPYTHIHKSGCSPTQLLHFFDQANLLQKEGRLFIEEGFPASLNIETLSLKTLSLKNTRKFSGSLLHQFIKIAG
jgi:16S rRNA (guanine(966)-N(2))-methyltransferase RsmD